MDVDSDYICPICKDVSDQPQQLHYGGRACFSCRAFFRRAHQKTKHPDFFCKKGNACEVTVKTRRRCQKCRYVLALKAGMQPEAVLTEDQKKVRFRNAIEKKATKAPGDEDELDEGPDQYVKVDSQDRDSGVHSNSSATEESFPSEIPPLVIDERLSRGNFLSASSSSTQQPPPFKRSVSVAIQPNHHHTTSSQIHPNVRLMSNFVQGHQQQRNIYQKTVDDFAPRAHSPLKRDSPPEHSHSHWPPHSQEHASLENLAPSLLSSPQKVHLNKRTNSLPLPVKKRKFNEEIENKSEEPEEKAEVDIEEIFELGINIPKKLEALEAINPEDDCIDQGALDLDDHDKMQGPFDLLMKGCGGPGCPLGRRQVQKVLAAFRLTCVQVDIDPHFVDTMVAFHRGDISKVPKTLFITHLKHLNLQYQHFAMLDKAFLGLSKRDKQSLVMRNAPLFIQYILGRYFSSETGYEQLKWLLGSHAPNMSPEEQKQLHLVSLAKFNKRLGLFKKYACLSTYEEFCKRLNYRSLKFKCTSVWNHIVLYHYDKDIMLDDPEAVHNLCEDSITILPHSAHYFGCMEKPNVHGMIATTEAMAKFFKANVQWISPIMEESTSSSDEENFRNCTKAISLRYSQEEDDWLNKQLDLYRHTVRQVSVGDDFMKEIVMFSLGVPLSKTFVKYGLGAAVERMRRALTMHEEFTELSGQLQRTIWQANVPFAVALYCAKMESCSTCEEQITYGCGHSDLQYVEEFKQIRDISKLKKIGMANCNQSTNTLTQVMIKNYLRLIYKVKELIQDKTTYELFSIVLLLSDIDGHHGLEKLQKLRQKYLKVIKRQWDEKQRLETEKAEEEDDEQDAIMSSTASDCNTGAKVIDKFNSCICDLRELSTIILKISPPP